MIVFFGDSITRDWPVHEVAGADAINAGVAGETTGTMRLRFAADVLQRGPDIVHLLGGINDIAENDGPVPLDETAANLEAMALEARSQGIGVVLGLLLPCTAVSKRPHLRPRPAIRHLNRRIQAFADRERLPVADYFAPLAGTQDELRADCTYDGLHPDAAGYALMTPVARDAIASLAGRQPGSEAVSRRTTKARP